MLNCNEVIFATLGWTEGDAVTKITKLYFTLN